MTEKEGREEFGRIVKIEASGIVHGPGGHREIEAAEKESFYVAARGGFNRDESVRVALLAGPYATRQEAQAMVQPVSQWAAEHSGNQWAWFFEFGVISLPTGLAASKLGSIMADALGLVSGRNRETESQEEQQGQQIKRGLSM